MRTRKESLTMVAAYIKPELAQKLNRARRGESVSSYVGSLIRTAVDVRELSSKPETEDRTDWLEGVDYALTIAPTLTEILADERMESWKIFLRRGKIARFVFLNPESQCISFMRAVYPNFQEDLDFSLGRSLELAKWCKQEDLFGPIEVLVNDFISFSLMRMEDYIHRDRSKVVVAPVGISMDDGFSLSRLDSRFQVYDRIAQFIYARSTRLSLDE